MRRSLVLAAALVLLGVTPAGAHVSVAPDEAARGATVTFTFTVENEEAPAKTTSVEVVLPQGVTFSTVTPLPKPGWTATPSESSVTWSGGAISGDAEEAFAVTLGPVPSGEQQLLFKTLQTYDNGTVVRWIGAASDDNPAPVVELTGAPVATVPITAATVPPTTKATAQSDDDGDDGGGAGVTALIVGAFVLAGIGGGIALSARRRAARP